MGTIKIILERFRVIALLIAGVFLLALAGCGDSAKAAPFGSTVTLQETQRIFATNVSGTPYTNQIYCRASVADEAGLPLAGIEVKLNALMAKGQDVTVYNVSGNAGDNLITTLTMNNSGFLDFMITASDQATGVFLNYPDPVVGTGVVSGGTLTTGPYTYTVSALDASIPARETVAQSLSTPVSNATTSNDSVLVSWKQVTGATAYRIYGRDATQLLLFTAASTTTMWIDTGGAAIGGAPPALGNQPVGIAANALDIGLRATTGAASAILDVTLY